MSDPAEPRGEPRILKVPDKVHTLEELIGVLRQMPMENIVVIVEDADGCTTLTIDGTTAERMNWMLDRAWLLLHRAD